MEFATSYKFANVVYDLDTTGFIMEDIKRLTAPPNFDSSKKEKKDTFVRNFGFKKPKSTNHEYCDSCFETGDLICCDRCPVSFHLQCFDPPFSEETVPKGFWLCRKCKVQMDIFNTKDNMIKTGMTSTTNNINHKKKSSFQNFSSSDCYIDTNVVYNACDNLNFPIYKNMFFTNLIENHDSCSEYSLIFGATYHKFAQDLPNLLKHARDFESKFAEDLKTSNFPPPNNFNGKFKDISNSIKAQCSCIFKPFQTLVDKMEIENPSEFKIPNYIGKSAYNFPGTIKTTKNQFINPIVLQHKDPLDKSFYFHDGSKTISTVQAATDTIVKSTNLQSPAAISSSKYPVASSSAVFTTGHHLVSKNSSSAVASKISSYHPQNNNYHRPGLPPPFGHHVHMSTSAAPPAMTTNNSSTTSQSNTEDCGNLFGPSSNGLVLLPPKLCFVCGRSCAKQMLIQCDYCPLCFHLDCLDPPLSYVPPNTHWMCPNHPEHILERKFWSDDQSLVDRVKIWDFISESVPGVGQRARRYPKFTSYASKVGFIRKTLARNLSTSTADKQSFRYRYLPPFNSRFRNAPTVLPSKIPQDIVDAYDSHDFPSTLSGTPSNKASSRLDLHLPEKYNDVNKTSKNNSQHPSLERLLPTQNIKFLASESLRNQAHWDHATNHLNKGMVDSFVPKTSEINRTKLISSSRKVAASTSHLSYLLTKLLAYIEYTTEEELNVSASCTNIIPSPSRNAQADAPPLLIDTNENLSSAVIVGTTITAAETIINAMCNNKNNTGSPVADDFQLPIIPVCQTASIDSLTSNRKGKHLIALPTHKSKMSPLVNGWGEDSPTSDNNQPQQQMIKNNDFVDLIHSNTAASQGVELPINSMPCLSKSLVNTSLNNDQEKNVPIVGSSYLRCIRTGQLFVLKNDSFNVIGSDKESNIKPNLIKCKFLDKFHSVIINSTDKETNTHSITNVSRYGTRVERFTTPKALFKLSNKIKEGKSLGVRCLCEDFDEQFVNYGIYVGTNSNSDPFKANSNLKVIENNPDGIELFETTTNVHADNHEPSYRISDNHPYKCDIFTLFDFFDSVKLVNEDIIRCGCLSFQYNRNIS